MPYCKDRALLLEEYSQATHAYSKAILAAFAEQAHHDALERVAEEACLKCESAREALEKHAAEHGCA
jgi:hypothetical protein